MNGFVTGGCGCWWGWGGAESHVFVRKMDPLSPIGTKIGTTMYLDTIHKPVTAFLKFPKFDLARRGQRSNFSQNHRFSDSKLHKMDPVSLRCTKIGTGMYLYTVNKPVIAILKF